MVRPNLLDDNAVISTRIEKKVYNMLQDIAALQTMTTGRKVTVQELIRNALNFVYTDNENMRECFRRARNSSVKRYK